MCKSGQVAQHFCHDGLAVTVTVTPAQALRSAGGWGDRHHTYLAKEGTRSRRLRLQKVAAPRLSLVGRLLMSARCPDGPLVPEGSAVPPGCLSLTGSSSC